MVPELVLSYLFLVSSSIPASPDSSAIFPTLYVSRVEGRVTAARWDGAVEAVRQRQVLPGAWRVTVPSRSRLAGVCSNDRRLRLEPANAQVLVRDACLDGKAVTKGTYRALTHDRLELAIERVHGTHVRLSSMPIRGSDEGDPLVPTLLEPRDTAVSEARPRIRWTRVHGAVEYVVELSGDESWRRKLEADDVSCVVEEHPPGRLEICSLPWPDDEPGLRPGETRYLTVGARTGRVTPLRSGDPRRLARAPVATTEAVAESLDALDEAAVTAPERALRKALVLAGAALIGEADRALRRSLAEHPTADGFLLLGSLELEQDLPRAASRSFRKVLELTSEATTPGTEEIARHARGGLDVAHRSLSRTLRTDDP